MKVLIVGSNGQLGVALQETAPPGAELVGADATAASYWRPIGIFLLTWLAFSLSFMTEGKALQIGQQVGMGK